jgi:predicted component of type VI protein secretion system
VTFEPLRVLGMVALLAGCSSSSAPAASPQLQVVTVSGAPLNAVAGDAVPFKVVVVETDGTQQELPSSAEVTWTSPAVVTALDPSSTAPSPLPV